MAHCRRSNNRPIEVMVIVEGGGVDNDVRKKFERHRRIFCFD